MIRRIASSVRFVAINMPALACSLVRLVTRHFDRAPSQLHLIPILSHGAPPCLLRIVISSSLLPPFCRAHAGASRQRVA
eukprot:4670278-Pyramimonas_sp.AAC.1